MQADPLQQLRALHTPDAPGWWPLAPGWWFLIALGIAVVLYLLRIALDLRRALKPHRQARQELNALNARLAAQGVDDRYLHDASALLKRVMLYALEDNAVAGRSGKAWLDALDALTESTGFTRGPGKLLADARFASAAPDVPEELPALLERALDAARRRAIKQWSARWLPNGRSASRTSAPSPSAGPLTPGEQP